MPENQLSERGNYWHADASACDVAALDAKYTKEADAGAENDALRDDVAAGRRRRIKAVCQPREATTRSAVIMQPPPDWQTPLNWDYFTSERGWSLCKNNWKEPRSILMSSVDRVAHIDGQLMQLLWAIHTRFQRSNVSVNKNWAIHLRMFAGFLF